MPSYRRAARTAVASPVSIYAPRKSFRSDHIGRRLSPKPTQQEWAARPSRPDFVAARSVCRARSVKERRVTRILEKIRLSASGDPRPRATARRRDWRASLTDVWKYEGTPKDWRVAAMFTYLSVAHAPSWGNRHDHRLRRFR